MLPWLLIHVVCYTVYIYCCYLIQYKETPVFAAACNGHVGTLNVLIKAKADVNATDVVSLIYIYILHEIILWYK